MEEEAWWAVPREEEGAGHFPTWAWILVASLPLYSYPIISAAVYIGRVEEEAWWAVPREEEGAGHFPTSAWVLVASLSL